MATVNLGEIFHASTGILDNLIEILNRNHWTVYKGNSFHEYHWPDIVLSERKLELAREEWDTDYLGAYFLTPLAIGEMKCQNVRDKEYETIENEGYIVLYENTILECASSIKLDDITPEQVIIGLSTIVLIHEFAHWIILDVTMDRLEKFDKTFFNNNYNTDTDVKDFHEGLAQYFTYHSIKDKENLKNVFLTLNMAQSSPYKIWKDLCNVSGKDLVAKNIEVILRAILIYLKLQIKCPGFKSQSFVNFKFIVKLLEKIESDRKFTLSSEDDILSSQIELFFSDPQVDIDKLIRRKELINTIILENGILNNVETIRGFGL